MSGLIKNIALATVLAAGGTTAASAAIVTNGGFEDGLAGWNVVNLSGTTPGVGVQTVTTNGAVDSTGYGDIVPSYDGGSSAVFFVDDNAIQSIWQKVSLVSGTEYTLSFALFGTQSGATNDFGFAFTESVVSDFLTFFPIRSIDLLTDDDVSVGGWQTYNYTFTANRTDDYFLNFAFVSGPTPAKDVLLDGVSITSAPVPEPATWAMMIAGLGMVGFAMRRRATKVQFA